MKTLCFDMDGTIADFYGVENWLAFLLSEDTTPYAVAKPLCNFSIFARFLNRYQKQGGKIGIISWGSKNSTTDFLERVATAKKKWLKKHLPSVNWDFIHVVPYGTPKEKYKTEKNAVLFDDEEKNRLEWNGTAYNVNNILEVLRNL